VGHKRGGESGKQSKARQGRAAECTVKYMSSEAADATKLCEADVADDWRKTPPPATSPETLFSFEGVCRRFAAADPFKRQGLEHSRFQRRPA